MVGVPATVDRDEGIGVSARLTVDELFDGRIPPELAFAVDIRAGIVWSLQLGASEVVEYPTPADFERLLAECGRPA